MFLPLLEERAGVRTVVQTILIFGVPTDDLKPRQLFQFLYAAVYVGAFGFCGTR